MMSRDFLRDVGAQDLVEYSLLLAFVALATAATFIAAGGSISTVWTAANNQLNQGAACAIS